MEFLTSALASHVWPPPRQRGAAGQAKAPALVGLGRRQSCSRHTLGCDSPCASGHPPCGRMGRLLETGPDQNNSYMSAAAPQGARAWARSTASLFQSPGLS